MSSARAGSTVRLYSYTRANTLPDLISPGEYHLAMLSIIEGAVVISREDLGVETARRFGFDRTGPDLKEEINRQILC
jgi:hypothetical protein